jgi:hypothetical protein
LAGDRRLKEIADIAVRKAIHHQLRNFAFQTICNVVAGLMALAASGTNKDYVLIAYGA